MAEKECNFTPKNKDMHDALYMKRRRLIQDLMEVEHSNNRLVAVQDTPKIQPCDSSSDIERQSRQSCGANKGSSDTSSLLDLHEECSCNINLYSENLTDLRISCFNANYDPKKKFENRQIEISDLIVTRNPNEGIKPLFESDIFKAISGCRCPIHSSKRIVTVVNPPIVGKELLETGSIHSEFRSSSLVLNSNLSDSKSKNYDNIEESAHYSGENYHKSSWNHHDTNSSNNKHKKHGSRKRRKSEDDEHKDRNYRRNRGHRHKSSKQNEKPRSDRSSSVEIIDERITRIGEGTGQQHTNDKVNVENRFSSNSSYNSEFKDSAADGDSMNHSRISSPALEEGEIDDSGVNERKSHSYHNKDEDFRQSFTKQVNIVNRPRGHWAIGRPGLSAHRMRHPSPRFQRPYSQQPSIGFLNASKIAGRRRLLKGSEVIDKIMVDDDSENEHLDDGGGIEPMDVDYRHQGRWR
ncbi:hypothetical protein GQR58_001808 [Nymphon striatum]|nr:hypothetical protein GQR58_001808 [Nymphon striatum]